MSRQEKLLAKLRSKPKGFTWGELCSLMNACGFELRTGDGSRRKFINPETKRLMSIHEPHPRNYLLDYQVNAVLNFLEENGVK